MIALYSSRPGREILLILNSGGVVMLMQLSKSLSLPVGIGASFPKVLISSASWNVLSFSALLQGVQSSPSSPSALLPSSSSSSLCFFLPMIVIVVIVLWQLWLFYWCSLRFLSLRCHDHNLEWFLLLRSHAVAPTDVTHPLVLVV
jgi:hypothetical protein